MEHPRDPPAFLLAKAKAKAQAKAKQGSEENISSQSLTTCLLAQSRGHC